MLINEVDFLIIGQGLAGSLLAWELINRGVKVLVIDNGLENASACAAGLINPITGMRLVKSTQLELLQPVAKSYYRQLADFFQSSFYIEKNMLRIFNSEKEVLQAQKRLQDKSYQAYLGKIIQTDEVYAPFGAIEQTQTGYLLTRPLLAALKQFFIDRQCYRKQQFDYTEINLDPELSWQGIKIKQIIFCEGYKLRDNPWFSSLPLQAAKGEILTLETLKPLPNHLLNYGHWLIPLNAHLCRTGATFEPMQLDTLCTEQAKETLLNSLQHVLPNIGEIHLQKQQANIRPTTLDKQPFIGKHPRYPQLAVFNGFGAKGSLQIPYYCQQFAEHLLQNKRLDSWVNIYRYPLTV